MANGSFGSDEIRSQEVEMIWCSGGRQGRPKQQGAERSGFRKKTGTMPRLNQEVWTEPAELGRLAAHSLSAVTLDSSSSWDDWGGLRMHVMVTHSWQGWVRRGEGGSWTDC